MNDEKQLAKWLDEIGITGKPLALLAKLGSIKAVHEALATGTLETIKGIGPATIETLTEAFESMKGEDGVTPAPDHSGPMIGQDPIDWPALHARFRPFEIAWVPVAMSQKKQGGYYPDGTRALVAAYVPAHILMNRLDAVVGPHRWQDSYEAGPDGGVMCGIGIEVEPGKWNWKYDGAENRGDSGQAVKGGFTSAFRRTAGLKLGMTRYLYDLPKTWVPVDKYGKPSAFPKLPEWALPKGWSGEQSFADPDPSEFGTPFLVDEDDPADVPAPQKAQDERKPDAGTKRPARQLKPVQDKSQSQAAPKRGTSGPQPIGEILKGMLEAYGPDNDWGDFVPADEKRLGKAKVNKRDYSRLKKHKEQYGWSDGAFNLLIRQVFDVSRVSALNLYQYYAAWRWITKEAVWREFEEMEHALQQERKDAKGSVPPKDESPY